MEPLELITHHTDWIFVLLLASVSMLLIAKFSAPKRFSVFLNLPIHTKKIEFIEEFKPFQGLRRFETLLSVNSYILLSMGLFVMQKAQGKEPIFFSNYLDFIRVLMFLTLFFLSKALINALLDWLYEHNGALAFATNVHLSYRIWMSFFLLPLIVLVVFLPSASFVLSIVLGVFMLVSYIQSTIQSNLNLWKIATPSYFKILYICALEMMPILFLIKWLF